MFTGGVNISIGQFLVDEGRLEQTDLDRALLVNDSDPKGLGLVSDRDLASAYASVFNLSLLKDEDIPYVPRAS